jgi:hypothetical protein
VNAYATPEQLAEYRDRPAPPNAAELLRRASTLIDRKVLVEFSIDDNGVPEDDELSEALQRAACAQVDFWMQTGDPSDVATRYASLSFGQTTIQGDSGMRLAPSAQDELSSVGLLDRAVG